MRVTTRRSLLRTSLGRCGTPGRSILGVALVLASLALARADAQPTPPRLPFHVGERLTYQVRVAKVGMSGRGSMWVDSGPAIRGRETYLLRFDFRARVGPVRVVDRTESWLDPLGMTALRFHKRERHPLSSHDEAVEIFPDTRRWQDADGSGGESPTDSSLDELSFMYFVRTLPLEIDSVYRFDRHFDASRNPVSVRAVRRESVETSAGTFRTILVEMRVTDPRHYRGEGVIRLNLTDDECRIPVRIESTMPVVGAAVLTLESETHRAGHVVPHAF